MLLRNYFSCLLLSAVLLPVFVQGQSDQMKNAIYHPLKVGDTVPEYRLANLINYPAKSAQLADFKGKLLILDFWATYCASCIHSWPKLLELQKEFGDKIQIVLIDPVQKESMIREVFEKRRKLAGVKMTLPTSCFDSTILKLFPVSGVPHVVWISPEGVVQSITESGPVNAKNISRIINHQPVEMTQKVNNDEIRSPSFEKPMLEGMIKDVFWQSMLAKSQQNIFHSLGITTVKGYGYFAIGTNVSIRDLYTLAYSTRRDMDNQILPFRGNRFVLQVKDTSTYVDRVDEDLQWQNLYNYQLLAPPTTADSIQKVMQADLYRFFGLHCKFEKREMKALVITCSDTSVVAYKEGKELTYFSLYDSVKLNRVPFSYFVEQLEDATAWGSSPYPVVDETGIKGFIGGFLLKGDLENPLLLDKALAPYKLHAGMETRWIDVLVITEPGYNDAVKQP